MFQINSTASEQWKLLLEQKSIGYVFPGAGGDPPASNANASTDHFYSASSSRQNSEELANYKHSADSPAANKSTADAAAADWKIVVPFSLSSNQLSDLKQVQRPRCLSPTVPDEMGIGPAVNAQSSGDVCNESEGGVDLSPEFVSGILPSARSRLASLKELGVKKIGALKMKLVENKVRSHDKGMFCSIYSINNSLLIYWISIE